MIIYVVQAGDTISSIANQFGISEARMILDNGLTNPNALVIGQTIVITYPEEVYVVQEGDTLSGIAMNYGIPILQLYRNNAFLWEREYIYPGEELIISYNTSRTMTTNAYVFPFVNRNTLKKSLPYLTYISILNYITLGKGEIESYYEDSELVELAKQFGVAPLMLLTSVSFQGVRNPETVSDILINPEYQDRHMQNMMKIIKEKGYYGLNITITYLTVANQELYLNYLTKLTSIMNNEGYPVFVTIDPNFMEDENGILFENVNYSDFNDLFKESYAMRFFWGTQYGPPMPISSMKNITLFIDYIKHMIDPDKINVGFPLLGYDWTLPYIQDFSVGNALTLEAAIELAGSMGAEILFDEESKTPYYEYSVREEKITIQHIVWFVDARTINELSNLVLENELKGTGVWNIMSYFSQLWLIINSNYTIEKILPEVF